jgi:hypothetical protein
MSNWKKTEAWGVGLKVERVTDWSMQNGFRYSIWLGPWVLTKQTVLMVKRPDCGHVSDTPLMNKYGPCTMRVGHPGYHRDGEAWWSN